MYFNYHAKIHKLLKENDLDYYEIVDRWNSISPALVLHFYSHPPMPIRIDKWGEYLPLLEKMSHDNKNRLHNNVNDK